MNNYNKLVSWRNVCIIFHSIYYMNSSGHLSREVFSMTCTFSIGTNSLRKLKLATLSMKALFIFRSGYKTCLWLVWKITYFALLTFKESLFDAHQQLKLSSSLLRTMCLFALVIESISQNNVVSSAYIIKS